MTCLYKKYEVKINMEQATAKNEICIWLLHENCYLVGE